MLDVRLFRNPRFTAASLSVTLVFFSLMGVLFFLTQYLQGVLGLSALETGVGSSRSRSGSSPRPRSARS